MLPKSNKKGVNITEFYTFKKFVQWFSTGTSETTNKTDRYDIINIVESGVKPHNSNPCNSSQSMNSTKTYISNSNPKLQTS
jgi:hypothetical protein